MPRVAVIGFIHRVLRPQTRYNIHPVEELEGPRNIPGIDIPPKGRGIGLKVIIGINIFSGIESIDIGVADKRFNLRPETRFQQESLRDGIGIVQPKRSKVVPARITTGRAGKYRVVGNVLLMLQIGRIVLARAIEKGESELLLFPPAFSRVVDIQVGRVNPDLIIGGTKAQLVIKTIAIFVRSGIPLVEQPIGGVAKFVIAKGNRHIVFRSDVPVEVKTGPKPIPVKIAVALLTQEIFAVRSCIDRIPVTGSYRTDV